MGIAEAEKFKPSHLNETLNLDEWQLVTYTYAAGEARFYRNGRLIYGASGISQPQPGAISSYSKSMVFSTICASTTAR